MYDQSRDSGIFFKPDLDFCTGSTNRYSTMTSCVGWTLNRIFLRACECLCRAHYLPGYHQEHDSLLINLPSSGVRGSHGKRNWRIPHSHQSSWSLHKFGAEVSLASPRLRNHAHEESLLQYKCLSRRLTRIWNLWYHPSIVAVYPF